MLRISRSFVMSRVPVRKNMSGGTAGGREAGRQGGRDLATGTVTPGEQGTSLVESEDVEDAARHGCHVPVLQSSCRMQVACAQHAACQSIVGSEGARKQGSKGASEWGEEHVRLRVGSMSECAKGRTQKANRIMIPHSLAHSHTIPQSSACENAPTRG